MRVQKALALLLTFLALSMAGCWDRTEVNDLAIITVIAIDRAEEGIRLSVAVVVPKVAAAGGGEGSSTGPTSVTYTAKGRSVMDAMMQMQLQVSRRLFWSHAGVLIFGEEYAREGIRPVLDFFSRHREPRFRMRVFVTPGEAAEILEVQPRLETILSEALREMQAQELMLRISLLDTLQALRAPGEHPVVPRVELVPTKGDGKNDVRLTGSAVFREDRLIGWLDIQESRGLLWLRGEIGTGVVTVELPGDRVVSTQLVRARTQVRPRFAGGQLRIEVLLETEDDLFETSALLDFDKEETIEMLEQLLEQAIRERVEDVLAKVQEEYGVDIFGFGDAVRRGAPMLWENGVKERWDEEFHEVPVDLFIKAHVRRTGEHGVPLGASKDEVEREMKRIMKGKE